jgi:hypothetical protein
VNGVSWKQSILLEKMHVQHLLKLLSLYKLRKNKTRWNLRSSPGIVRKSNDMQAKGWPADSIPVHQVIASLLVTTGALVSQSLQGINILLGVYQNIEIFVHCSRYLHGQCKVRKVIIVNTLHLDRQSSWLSMACNEYPTHGKQGPLQFGSIPVAILPWQSMQFYTWDEVLTESAIMSQCIWK